MKKKLSQLLTTLKDPELFQYEDYDVTGLTYDSRKAAPGFVFFALPGLHVDGRAFIPKAVAAGAVAVVFDDNPGALSPPGPPDRGIRFLPGAAYIRVADARLSMAPAAASFYDYPSGKLSVTGVTGTDGKSTTVYLIHQLFEMMGYKSGFFSTVHYKTEEEVRKNTFRQSTPEALEVQEVLHRMVKAGKTHAVIEATSHGLSERTGRLGMVDFKAGVFTNLSHEHLEFHGTFEQYRHDKANLFRRVSGLGVINLDDPNSGGFRQAAGEDNPASPPVYGYSLKVAGADLYAEAISEGPSSIEFSLKAGGKRLPVLINLPGLFNVENVMAAVLCVSKLTGAAVEDLVPFLPRLSAVPGRMQVLSLGQPFTVIIDYAHTPGAFLKLFPLVRTQCPKKLIAVFGSAGERDVEKRSIQGKIAGDYADLLILTDEDPRGEDSMDIIEEIAAGCPGKDVRGGVLKIPDRKEAIREAFNLARPGDLVLLLGKGHEGSIIHKDGAAPWDETSVAEAALKSLGFGG